MPEYETCPPGQEIMSENRCEEAKRVASWLGLKPSRNELQKGHWPGVPAHCSVQTKINEAGFKDDVHWNTMWDSTNGRLKSGVFQAICEAGNKNYLEVNNIINVLFTVIKQFYR